MCAAKHKTKTFPLARPCRTATSLLPQTLHLCDSYYTVTTLPAFSLPDAAAVESHAARPPGLRATAEDYYYSHFSYYYYCYFYFYYYSSYYIHYYSYYFYYSYNFSYYYYF